MIFKVLYQDLPYEVPVRERSKSIYIKADSEKDVLNKLEDLNYNIEYIQPLSELHLAYEKQSEHFELEKL